MGNKNQSENSEAAPVSQQVVTDVAEKKQERPITYVVVREGFRVSDREYSDIKDPAAVAEQEFWKLIATNHSYGEPVSIVQYDSKKHRVW